MVWFIIIIFILLVLFGLFKPKLHGHIGELSVRYRLSKLDPAKYAVINNIIVVNDGESVEESACNTYYCTAIGLEIIESQQS